MTSVFYQVSFESCLKMKLRGFKLIFALILKDEILVNRYHQGITNRIRKEIKKGNRNFEEFKISDVEFQCIFDNNLEKFKEYLKLRKKKNGGFENDRI